MRGNKFSRRELLKGSSALALSAYAAPARAAAPEPTAVTPQLIEAAKKEGKIAWYTSLDLPVSERVAKAFEAKYSGIAVRVERTGAERVFQRIGQEYASRIHAVDVVQSSDAAHFIVWKRDGMLLPYVPEDVAKHWPEEHKDPDGQFATFRAWLCVLGYNTNLVKAEEAPKSFADLLDPKWAGKLVKAHPGYSGTIMTATFQIARDLGWDYLEKLSKQRVMQVQSSADPPKKLALGERAVMADGNEYNMFQLKEKGDPVEIIYPAEGTPLIIGPNAVMKNAPNPNAAKHIKSLF
jgi:iron(III) transport system substrate-binding protein